MATDSGFDVDGFAEANHPDKIRVSELERTNAALRGKLTEAKADNKSLQIQVAELERRFEFWEATKGAKPETIKIDRRTKSKAKGEACPVIQLSDWHVEKRVDPRKVGGMNEYDLDIAAKRIKKLFESILFMVRKERDSVNIVQLCAWLGGDLMEGYLRDENLESNQCSPSEALLWLQGHLLWGIHLLLDELKLERLVIPCNDGNHGRATKKKQGTTRVENSWEWLMYHQLRMAFEGDDRVEFHIAQGQQLFVDILGHPCRFMHGDNIKFGGGIGGLAVPLSKAVLRLNDQRKCSYTFLGHFHDRVDWDFACVNGCLIGYDPYAFDEIKAPNKPPQQAYVQIDKDHGKTIVAPLFCV